MEAPCNTQYTLSEKLTLSSSTLSLCSFDKVTVPAMAGGRVVLQLLQCGVGCASSLWLPPSEGDQGLGGALPPRQPGLVCLLQLCHWLVLLRPSPQHHCRSEGLFPFQWWLGLRTSLF